MLKCCYFRKKNLSKHGLSEAVSKEFKYLSVMIYEQFIVSIVELIMLSWQPILLYNSHNMTVIWLFCHFFKLQVHILHGLKISQLLIFGNCDLSDVKSFSVK